MAGGGEETKPAGDEHVADGRRVVRLLIPYRVAGVYVATIDMAPCTLGHLFRWQAGQIATGQALLEELSGRTTGEIEGLRIPDDGRVMDAFFAHVHPDIASDIRNGRVPVAGGVLMAPPSPPVAPSVASGGPPAAAAGLPALGAVDPEDAGPGAPDDVWGGHETFGRPLDYIAGVDD